MTNRPSFVLTADELVDLTSCRRSDAQGRALAFMRIPYSTRRDGSIALLHSVAERALGATGTMAVPPQEPELQP